MLSFLLSNLLLTGTSPRHPMLITGIHDINDVFDIGKYLINSTISHSSTCSKKIY